MLSSSSGLSWQAGKNHCGYSGRQEWHGSTLGLDVPGLIPLLNHSVLESEARHHSFHTVRLMSLRKKISSLSSFQHIWIKVTVKYTESITDGLLWDWAAKHAKGMDTQSVSQWWIMERDSKAKPRHISSSFQFIARKKTAFNFPNPVSWCRTIKLYMVYDCITLVQF